MSIDVNRPIEGMRVWTGRALRWWVAELRAAWRDAAQHVRAARGNLVTIEAGERQWLIRRGKQPPVSIDAPSIAPEGLPGLFDPAGRITVLIPPERVLSKTVALPDGAEGQLDRIIGFEIARHFPFAAERVFFGHRVVGRQGSAITAAQAGLAVEIAAVPREVVFAISDELAGAGLRATSFALIPAPNATPLVLPHDPLIAVAKGRSIDRRWPMALAALAAVAAISWPVAQQVRLAALDREIAALKPAAEAALKVRGAEQHASDQQEAITRLRTERLPLVAVLDRLSRDIPDGAWLVSLSINGHELVLDGLAPSAASIATALQRNPVFSAISFRSPIARDAATGLEHFQLGATLTEARQ